MFIRVRFNTLLRLYRRLLGLFFTIPFIVQDVKLFIFYVLLISDLRMPVQSENRQSLRVQRRRLKALLDKATRDNDKAEAMNAAMERKIELMKLLIVALEGCPPVESK